MERSEVPIIRGPESIDIGSAGLGSIDQIHTSPTEGLGAAITQEAIGKQSGMPTISVGERVYQHQFMMQPYGLLVERVGIVLVPGLRSPGGYAVQLQSLLDLLRWISRYFERSPRSARSC